MCLRLSSCLRIVSSCSCWRCYASRTVGACSTIRSNGAVSSDSSNSKRATLQREPQSSRTSSKKRPQQATTRASAPLEPRLLWRYRRLRPASPRHQRQRCRRKHSLRAFRSVDVPALFESSVAVPHCETDRERRNNVWSQCGAVRITRAPSPTRERCSRGAREIQVSWASEARPLESRLRYAKLPPINQRSIAANVLTRTLGADENRSVGW